MALLTWWFRRPVRVRWDEISDPARTYSVRLDGTPACTYPGTLDDGEQTSCTLPPLFREDTSAVRIPAGRGAIQWVGSLCSYYFDYYYVGDLYLDCWGGGWIRSNYIFAIPASTFRTSWSVAGRQYSCYEGLFSKTGTRLLAYTFSSAGLDWRLAGLRYPLGHPALGVQEAYLKHASAYLASDE